MDNLKKDLPTVKAEPAADKIAAVNGDEPATDKADALAANGDSDDYVTPYGTTVPAGKGQWADAIRRGELRYCRDAGTCANGRCWSAHPCPGEESQTKPSTTEGCPLNVPGEGACADASCSLAHRSAKALGAYEVDGRLGHLRDQAQKQWASRTPCRFGASCRKRESGECGFKHDVPAAAVSGRGGAPNGRGQPNGRGGPGGVQRTRPPRDPNAPAPGSRSAASDNWRRA